MFKAMLPNLITLSRLGLAASFAIILAIWAHGDHGPISTRMMIVLMAIAFVEELSDHLDGRIARATGMVTPLGTLLDPLADSLARLTIYFAISLEWWVTPAVPLTMVARDVIVGYCRLANATTGRGRVTVQLSGSLKTIVQSAGIFALVFLAWAPQKGAPMETIVLLRDIVAGVSIAVTLWSLSDYVIRSLPAIRILLRPYGNL
jgi:CDP-diacylglycerol--glycerol-3-phosphate 3-phosphatidyltransferase